MSEFESLNKTLLIKHLNSYCHHHISKTVVIKFKSRSHGWKCREAHWEDTGFHGYTSSPALSLDFCCHPAQSNYKKLKKFIPNDFQGRKKYYLVGYLPVPSSLSFWTPNITNISTLKENAFSPQRRNLEFSEAWHSALSPYLMPCVTIRSTCGFRWPREPSTNVPAFFHRAHSMQ